MFTSTSIPIPSLILLLLVIVSTCLCYATDATSSNRGPNASTIYEVLRENGLPMGLFPKGVKEFEVGEDGRFWVHLDQACNAKFENVLHYDRNVSGSIGYGMIDSLTGLEAQDLFLWLRVMSIRVDDSTTGMICFELDAANKRFPLSLFETPPECVAVRSQDAVHRVPKDQSGKLRYKLDQGTSGSDVL